MKFFILCLSFLLLSACGGNSFSSPDLETTTEQLPSTEIVNDLNTKINNKNNVIWTPTFQIAWNQIKNDMIKDKILLNKKSPQIDYLNQNEENILIPKNNYLAISGLYTPSLIEKVNNKLKSSNRNYTVNSENWTEKDILAWAFFFKNIQFKYEFPKLDKSINFANSQLASFGFNKFKNSEHSKIGEQVKILTYFNKDAFVISLAEKNGAEIILAKIDPSGNLNSTWQYVSGRLTNSPEYLQDDDILELPSINFDITKSYEELLFDYLQNPNWQNSYLAKSLHNVRLQMMNGEVVPADLSKLALSGKVTAKEPKNMVFDRPFLLAIKDKKSDKPYLVMWVADPEILVKF